MGATFWDSGTSLTSRLLLELWHLAPKRVPLLSRAKAHVMRNIAVKGCPIIINAAGFLPRVYIHIRNRFQERYLERVGTPC